MPSFFKKGGLFSKQNPKSTKPSSVSFNYQPKDPLKQAEAQVLRRFSFLFALVILLFVTLYLWGVPLVAGIGSFWQNFTPNQNGNINNDSSILAAPRLDSLPSTINDFSKLKVSGWSNPGQKVQLVINDQVQKETVADVSGRFEFTDLTLNTGQNQINAKVTSGKTEAKSSVQIVVYSKTPPKLEVSSPQDGLEITDPAQNWITVSGQTLANVTLTVNDHQAIVDVSGNFKYQYLLSSGDNRLSIKAVDEAGNQSVVERTVKFNPPSLSPTPSS